MTIGPQRSPSSVRQIEAQAVHLRREWLRLMGLSQDKIDENVREIPPTDHAKEQQELDAMRMIQRDQIGG